LPDNRIQGWKTVTNTVAYYDAELFVAEKGFVALTFGAKKICRKK